MDEILNVKSAIAIEFFFISVTFDDGLIKVIDMKPMIKTGVSAALLNTNYFNNVKVENGYITWENGFDCCPVFLREL